jgi:hypothetical protein
MIGGLSGREVISRQKADSFVGLAGVGEAKKVSAA